ncbi:UrcA family protein [Haliea sp. E1-2-M8]|uniref:UrcA family protein n=1 Tax=Haliea sp. E1-2-M8 TaxID=3064706 RepID=UPI00272331F2|nr:UrcA family protein [Haliea sp. E1-2-M8]MDO8860621.1 UrcA family protein [Haliea sp. E1-2-M8]
MKTQINNRIAALVLSLGSCLAASAMAGSYQEATLVQAHGMETRTASVSVADLNLSSVEGRDALHGRLSQAAREVCGPTDYRVAGSIRVAANNRACQKSAVAGALAQVNAGQIASISK